MLEDLKSTYMMHYYDKPRRMRKRPLTAVGALCRLVHMRCIATHIKNSYQNSSWTLTLIVDDTPRVWSEHREFTDRSLHVLPLRADELCFFLRRRMRTVEEQSLLFIRLCKEGDEHPSAKMDCREHAGLRREI
jgi:hypothetical protein